MLLYWMGLQGVCKMHLLHVCWTVCLYSSKLRKKKWNTSFSVDKSQINGVECKSFKWFVECVIGVDWS